MQHSGPVAAPASSSLAVISLLRESAQACRSARYTHSHVTQTPIFFVTMLYLRAGRIVIRRFWSNRRQGCRRTKLRPADPSTADRASILRVGENEWQSRFWSPRLAQASRIGIEKPSRHTPSQGADPAMNRAIQVTHSNVGYSKSPTKNLGQYLPLAPFGPPNHCMLAVPDFLGSLNRQSRTLESAV
jgi:hypothetical protein